MAIHALTIMYVDDVAATVKFFETVLGSSVAMIDEKNGYAQLAGQGTNLAFVSKKMMSDFLGSEGKIGSPDSFELTFVTDDVKGVLAKATEAGATLITGPREAFWSKEVAYIKSPDGILIEICLPMQGM